MRDHLFIDIKLSADKNGGEISGIRTDGEGDVKAAYRDAFTTIRDRPAEEPHIDVAWRGFHSCLIDGRSNDIIVVCYFIEYTWTVYQKLVTEYNLKDYLEGRAWIDIAQLAWPLMHKEIIPNRSLKTVAQYYGVTMAGDNAKIMSDVYFRVMRRYDLATQVEGKVRMLGGGTLERVLKGLGGR